jgi:hypothetical protein
MKRLVLAMVTAAAVLLLGSNAGQDYVTDRLLAEGSKWSKEAEREDEEQRKREEEEHESEEEENDEDEERV